jgi:hypothetical protein
LAFAGLGVGLLARDSGAQPAAEAQKISRIVQVSRTPWESGCELDVCRIQILLETPITTPVEAERVDLVVRVGLTYRTSRGDRASAAISLDTGTPPWPQLPPGALALAPAWPGASTTTLTWARRSLPAAGRRYVLNLAVAPKRGRTGAEGASVSGAKTVLVAETSW